MIVSLGDVFAVQGEFVLSEVVQGGLGQGEGGGGRWELDLRLRRGGGSYWWLCGQLWWDSLVAQGLSLLQLLDLEGVL